jgi:hypothetical protein
MALTGDPVASGLLGKGAIGNAYAAHGTSGAAFLTAALSGGDSPAAILTAASPGDLSVVVRAGSVSPTGTSYSDFLTPSGCGSFTTFWADLGGAPVNQPGGSGIFLMNGSGTVAVAVTGDPAPGGGLYTALDGAPGVDSSGRMVFLAVSTPDELPALLQRESTGTVNILLKPGDTAPGGGVVTEISWAGLSCAGSLSVLVSVDGASGTQPLLLSGAGAMPAPVLAGQDPLPDGSRVLGFSYPPVMESDGTIFVLVSRDTGGSQALLRIPVGGDPEILAVPGDTVASGGTLSAFGPLTLAAPGQVAWLGAVAPAGDPGSTSPAVLGASAGGAGPEVLLEPGDLSPDDEPLTELGDPTGRGDGSLFLRMRSDGEAAREGLAHWLPGAARWLAYTGQELPALGRLLAGGCRNALPAVDSDGRVALVASLTGSLPARGLLLSDPGGPAALLLAEGDTTPGGATILSLDGAPVWADGGAILLPVSLVDSAPFSGLLARETTGSLGLRLAQGDPSPAGGTFRTLGRVLKADSAGRVGFAATLAGTAAASGIFTLHGLSPPRQAMLAGEPAPDGETFTAFGFAPAPLDSGGVAFLAFTSGGGRGIFLVPDTAAAGEPPATAVAIARDGDPAPGGGTLSVFANPTSGGLDTVAFLATLDDGTEALFATGGGSPLRRLLAAGDTLIGAEVVQGIGEPAIDGQGQVFTAVEVTGAPYRMAVVAVDGTGIERLLVDGDVLPSTPAGPMLLDDFGPLGAGGISRLALAVDLRGWSEGAAIVMAAEDLDGDGWGDPADCAPQDEAAFQLPPAAGDLRAMATDSGGASVTFQWSGLAAAAGPGTVHDVLAGALAELHDPAPYLGAACALSGLPGVDAEVVDGTPAPGTGWWYLIRGRNACGDGEVGPGHGREALDQVSCAAP